MPEWGRDGIALLRMRQMAGDGLLRQSGDGMTMRHAVFSPTEAAVAVLAGESHRLDVAGFERWIGGVHLQTQGPLWCQDGDGLVVWQRHAD